MKLKLYTINATPLRPNDTPEGQAVKLAKYPHYVAKVMKENNLDGFTMYQVMGY